MTLDEFLRLVDGITPLLSALAWPLLVLFVLLRFGPSLHEFFANLGEITGKFGGFEASVKRARAEAQTALVAAEVGRPSAVPATPEVTSRKAREAATVATEAVSARTVRQARGATVLWVDDRPDNNLLERQSLEAVGISFVLARSTDEALRETARRRFDVIISDMGRPPDPRAGYTLLKALRQAGDTTPFVIYASSNAQADKDAARAAGALGSTNRASELFSLVLGALKA